MKTIQVFMYSYIVKGRKYSTLREIAQAEGVTEERVRQKMNDPSYAEYQRFLPNGLPAHGRKTKRRESAEKPCTVNRIEYESQDSAAEGLGLNVGTLRYRLRSSNFPNYTSKHHPKGVKKRYPCIECNVGGVQYSSARQASIALGITYYKMKCLLASPDYPDYISPLVPKK